MRLQPIAKLDLDSTRKMLMILAKEGDELLKRKSSKDGNEIASEAKLLKNRISHFVAEFNCARNKVAEFEMAHASKSDKFYMKDEIAVRDADLNVSASDLSLYLEHLISSLEESRFTIESSVKRVEDSKLNVENAAKKINKCCEKSTVGCNEPLLQALRFLEKSQEEMNAKLAEQNTNYQSSLKVIAGFKEQLREKDDNNTRVELIEASLRETKNKMDEMERKYETSMRLKEEKIESLEAKVSELEKKVEENESELRDREEQGRMLREKLENAESNLEEFCKQQQSMLNLAIGKSLDCSKMFPRCYIDIFMQRKRYCDKQNLRRVIIRLQNDVAPRTAEHFRALCAGERGISYVGCSFSQLCDAGGYFYGPPNGPPTLREKHFPAEENELKHVGPGVVSMRKIDRNTCNSYFNITWECASDLDRDDCGNVVFGVVIDGMEVLSQMKCETNELNATRFSIRGCGQCE